MGYAVELCFDPASEKKIREYWQILCNNELTKFLCELPGGRPHVSLAVYEQVNVALLEEKLAYFVRNKSGFKLRFESMSTFPNDPSIVFLAPVMNSHLFQLHREYHELMDEFTCYERKYYLPEQWVPHCALATDIPREKVSEVYASLINVFQPFEVYVDEVELGEFMPIKKIRNYCFYDTI